MNPTCEHNIPVPNELNTVNLETRDAVTSDTCNTAMKTRRLIVTRIEEAAVNTSTTNIKVLEVDCWNHLRKLWLYGMNKILSQFLRNTLCDKLGIIDLGWEYWQV